MTLELLEKHPVIGKFEPIEINDFTILTGINGAGKTQILKAINEGKIRINSSSALKIIYVNSKTFEEESHNQSSIYYDLSNISMIYSAFKNYKMGTSHPQRIISNEKYFIGSDEDYYKIFPVFEKISLTVKKDILDLDYNDLNLYGPLQLGVNAQSIFYSQFASVFTQYHKMIIENGHNTYDATKYNRKDISYVSEEDFVNIHGQAPWDFANDVLEKAKIAYKFDSPLISSPNSSLKIILRNIYTNDIVPYNNLSSGEKVILSLVFAMYNSETIFKFPEIILMDEPDASLHPSMIRHFLNVINDIFVKDKKVKVIITTHSPTTVALADEKNIYHVESPNAIIQKKSKDAVLNNLSEGVPSFSVNYENRRQIFVESPYDVEFYERLYEIYSSKLEPQISLNFIASGSVQKDKHGSPVNSCDTVVNITKLMRNAGNNFVWGIIDYDNKNESTNHIKVLGEGNRYSTENYFFDPILLAVFLLIEGFAKTSEIGLKDNEKYIDIINFDNERLQIICNSVLTKISEAIEPDDNQYIKCKLINGCEIELPNWFLKHQGHDLELAIKKVFPQLNAYNRDGDKTLKVAIIKKVIATFPGLASEDLLLILKAIQE